MKNILVVVGIIATIGGIYLWKQAEQDFVNDTGVTCPSLKSDIDCAVFKVDNMEDKQRLSVFISIAGAVVAAGAGISLLRDKNIDTVRKS